MKKKTHEEYVQELSIKNPIIEVIGKYIDTNTKITHRCLIHNEIWDVKPASVLRGAGCKKCHSEKIINSKIKTNEKYEEDVKRIQPHIKVKERYIDARTPIKHYCTIHSVLWNSAPTNILHGYGCPECGKDKVREKNSKTNKDYIDELAQKNPFIISLEYYINASTPIRHKCLLCGYEWCASPGNILYGTGCPECKESHGEKEICTWLKKNNIKYITQYKFKNCKDKRLLPFDFYLPTYNCCIEYDGKQHFESVEYFGGEEAFQKRIKHDQIKDNYCKNNGITLLRIPYYKNIEEELNNFLVI